MSKDNFCLLILEDSGFFCNCNSSFFRITGNHNHLDSGMIQNLNGLNRIFSYVISQAENCKKDFLTSCDLHYRKKLHGSLCLCNHLLFYFCLFRKSEVHNPAVFCHIMRHFIDDVLRSTFPVNRSIIQFYSRTFFLGIKSADFLYLRCINLLRTALCDGISQKSTVHVVASDRLAFRNLCKVIQSDCFQKIIM